MKSRTVPVAYEERAPEAAAADRWDTTATFVARSKSDGTKVAARIVEIAGRAPDERRSVKLKKGDLWAVTYHFADRADALGLAVKLRYGMRGLGEVSFGPHGGQAQKIVEDWSRTEILPQHDVMTGESTGRLHWVKQNEADWYGYGSQSAATHDRGNWFANVFLGDRGRWYVHAKTESGRVPEELRPDGSKTLNTAKLEAEVAYLKFLIANPDQDVESPPEELNENKPARQEEGYKGLTIRSTRAKDRAGVRTFEAVTYGDMGLVDVSYGATRKDAVNLAKAKIDGGQTLAAERPVEVRDYIVIGSSGTQVFGPTKDYQEARRHAFNTGGYVEFVPVEAREIHSLKYEYHGWRIEVSRRGTVFVGKASKGNREIESTDSTLYGAAGSAERIIDENERLNESGAAERKAKVAPISPDQCMAVVDGRAQRLPGCMPTGHRCENARHVWDLLHGYYAGKGEEETLVVLVNVQGEVSGQPIHITTGQRDSVRIEVEQVLGVVLPATRTGAAGFLLVHNHPSSRARPSESDRDLTKRVQAAKKAYPRTAFLDHVIIAPKSATAGEFFSFSNADYLSEIDKARSGSPAAADWGRGKLVEVK